MGINHLICNQLKMYKVQQAVSYSPAGKFVHYTLICQ